MLNFGWGESDFARLAEVIAPGRCDFVAVIEAYFDESFGSNGDLLCVAGYVFKKSKARRLDAGWRRMLADYDLPYFRMSACAGGGRPFDKLSVDRRDACARQAIKLISENASAGFANTTYEREFERLVPDQETYGGAYEFLVWNCLMGVRRWFEEKNQRGDVAYFFEAGHANQSKANRVMNMIFAEPELRKGYRYAGHAFVRKEVARPVQAADVLAYHFYKDQIRQSEGKPRRKDYAALRLGMPILSRHVDPAAHAATCERLIEEEASEASWAQPSS